MAAENNGKLLNTKFEKVKIKTIIIDLDLLMTNMTVFRSFVT